MHDVCYSNCRETKKSCDYDFFVCLNKNCFDDFCSEFVDFIITLVENYGCKAYLNSQKNVCVC